MRTRSERGQLMLTAERKFGNLKNELINENVVDIAVNIYGILSTISAKYSSEAIVDLIPELTSLLNRFDASLKVNEDLKNNLTELHKENDFLAKSLEKEKKFRKVDLENSLHSEEKAEEEIRSLRQSVNKLEEIKNSLQDDLKNKNAIIDILTTDNRVLLNQTEDGMENELIKPKYKNKSSVTYSNTPLETKNTYSVLSTGSTEATSEAKYMNVTVQVHRPATPSVLVSSTPAASSKNIPQIIKEGRKKRRVAILSDSQGRDIHKHMIELKDDFDVFVYSVPGGKLKHVMSQGIELVKDYTKDDFVIVLAGSNDVGVNEPAQLTIRKGMDLLFSLKTNTNILLNHIPYRYDKPNQNNNIFFYNQNLSKMAQHYRGELNIICQDINSILGRSHFTRHGLHYSRHGKRHLGNHFCNFVRNYRPHVHPTQKKYPAHCPQATAYNQCTAKVPRRVDSDLLDIIECLPSQSPNHSQSLPVAHIGRTPSHTPIPCTVLNLSSFSSPKRADVSNSCSLPRALGSLQSSPDITTSSEPWGRSAFVSSGPSDNFLDPHSWPNLVK